MTATYGSKIQFNSPSFEKNRMALGVLEKCISIWGNLILLRSEYPTTKHCFSKHRAKMKLAPSLSTNLFFGGPTTGAKIDYWLLIGSLNKSQELGVRVPEVIACNMFSLVLSSSTLSFHQATAEGKIRWMDKILHRVIVSIPLKNVRCFHQDFVPQLGILENSGLVPKPSLGCKNNGEKSWKITWISFCQQVDLVTCRRTTLAIAVAVFGRAALDSKWGQSTLKTKAFGSTVPPHQWWPGQKL